MRASVALLLLLPRALPHLDAGGALKSSMSTRPAALLCDPLIDSAKRCNFCPEAVAAHAACIEHHAAEMGLLTGGTRRERCRHGEFEYSVYDVFVGRSLLHQGEFSEVEWRDVLRPALLRRHARGSEGSDDLGAGPVGFDVGANIGVFTVPMARTVSEYRGRVVAIEADVANHALLRINAALNRPDGLVDGGEPTVLLLHAAASVMPRPAVDAPSGVDAAALSLRQRLGNFGSPELSQTVKRVSIDQIMAEEGLTQCDVIKVDVEGHELQVLQGAVATISRHRPVLYVENDRYSTAVLEYLAVRDYRCVWHVPPLFSPSNWKNSTQIVFTEESANLICHHESMATGVPRWVLSAQSVTADNQLSTLATARVDQNLQHYDMLGEQHGGRWWLHGAELLRGVAKDGWGEQQRASLERVERYFQSQQQNECNGSCDASVTKDEGSRDRLLYALNTKAVLLQQHADTIADQGNAQSCHTEAVVALRQAVGIAPATQHSAVLANLGNALTASGDPSGAVDCFNELLGGLSSEGSDSHRDQYLIGLEGKAWALQQAKRFVEAVDAYSQAISIGHKRRLPARPKTVVSLGVCLAQLGRLDVRLATAAKLHLCSRPFYR
jgi:FkbM family methyltransferase